MQLSKSFTLPNGIVIPNRIAKSALSEGIAEANGSPSESLFNLYERWGAGGAGILFTGNVNIDKGHLTNANVMILEKGNPHLEAYTQLAEKAQANGTHLWIQISHPGRQTPKYLTPEPVSASDVALPMGLYNQPRPLTEDEIWDIVERFGDAALLAKQAGMKGAQIHGAHGYLVSQFLSALTNLRTDQWGGSLGNRARFCMEIYKNMRTKCGADFPLGIKINSADFQRGGFTEEESMQVIQWLDEAGMDLIEVSGGTYERAAMVGTQHKESTIKREAYFLEFIKKVRKKVKTPLMLTGGFRTVETMEAAIENGELDFIGMGRPFCLFPNIAKELMDGSRTDCTVPDLLTGVPNLDMSGMMQTPWHMFQLARMGKGMDPDPEMDVWMVYEKITGKPRPEGV